MSEPDRSRSCPSGRSVLGASLIGIVGKDGRLGYLREEIPVDEVFLTMVQARLPLRRFRFSEPCVESRCSQWTGTRCGLIDEILDGSERTLEADIVNLPRCSIRSSCRWFHQVGRQACTVCPLIVRGGDEED
jgi:hypothetical protein